MKKLKNFFKGVKKEGKTVRWPSGKTLVNYSVITVVMLIFFGLFFELLKFIFSLLGKLILSLSGGLL